MLSGRIQVPKLSAPLAVPLSEFLHCNVFTGIRETGIPHVIPENRSPSPRLAVSCLGETGHCLLPRCLWVWLVWKCRSHAWETDANVCLCSLPLSHEHSFHGRDPSGCKAVAKARRLEGVLSRERWACSQLGALEQATGLCLYHPPRAGNGDTGHSAGASLYEVAIKPGCIGGLGQGCSGARLLGSTASVIGFWALKGIAWELVTAYRLMFPTSSNVYCIVQLSVFFPLLRELLAF
uniref:Uncharacterized protein n=1 Tax=Amazona collaria TaxID=241587 RepID=A0A8B9J1Z6_9PSIT